MHNLRYSNFRNRSCARETTVESKVNEREKELIIINSEREKAKRSFRLVSIMCNNVRTPNSSISSMLHHGTVAGPVEADGLSAYSS